MGKSITIEPATGGQLRTAISAERPGILHYTVKSDWRRELDREVRREGHDYFWPLTYYVVDGACPLGNQPFPQNQPTAPAVSLPLNLVHLVQAANGETTPVVGTETTLYTFYPARTSLIGPYFEPGEVPDDAVIVPSPDVPFIPWVDPQGFPPREWNWSSTPSGYDFYGGPGVGVIIPPDAPPPGTPVATDPDDPPVDPNAGGGAPENPSGDPGWDVPTGSEVPYLIKVTNPLITTEEGGSLRGWINREFLSVLIAEYTATILGEGFSSVRVGNIYWDESGIPSTQTFARAEEWFQLQHDPPIEHYLVGGGSLYTACALLIATP